MKSAEYLRRHDNNFCQWTSNLFHLPSKHPPNHQRHSQSMWNRILTICSSPVIEYDALWWMNRRDMEIAVHYSSFNSSISTFFVARMQKYCKSKIWWGNKNRRSVLKRTSLCTATWNNSRLTAAFYSLLVALKDCQHLLTLTHIVDPPRRIHTPFLWGCRRP